VISRLRALFKRGEIRFIRLDVNRLVQETLSLANGDLTTRSIQTLTQLAPALPAVRGDRVQLQQVMLNLIMNACEAMAGIRTEERKLTVRTLAADGRVYLTVTDHGPGFAPEEHERLFEPYYTTKPHGLGLGLSISRTIVAAHGGKLWGVGTPGAGATFHVALPVVGP
jgi:two-component system sensor kinase FixL